MYRTRRIYVSYVTYKSMLPKNIFLKMQMFYNLLSCNKNRLFNIIIYSLWTILHEPNQWRNRRVVGLYTLLTVSYLPNND